MRTFYTAVVLLAPATLCVSAASAQVREREMERINRMEFKETVPSKVQTVLLPTGTLEPHGVVNNGADITAPLAS
jgi:creatinine amidohydrolase